MSKVITYKNTVSECFCQIKLDDGNRILISIANTICLYKMKWLGAWPSEKLFEFSLSQFLYSKFPPVKKVREQTGSFADPLDILRDVLIQCNSIEEVKTALNGILKEI